MGGDSEFATGYVRECGESLRRNAEVSPAFGVRQRPPATSGAVRQSWTAPTR